MDASEAEGAGADAAGAAVAGAVAGESALADEGALAGAWEQSSLGRLGRC